MTRQAPHRARRGNGVGPRFGLFKKRECTPAGPPEPPPPAPGWDSIERQHTPHGTLAFPRLVGIGAETRERVPRVGSPEVIAELRARDPELVTRM